MQLPPIVYVVFLSIAQFVSDRFNIERSRNRLEISSFAAAVAITYLLFNFLPKVYRDSDGLPLFIPLVSGFFAIYLLEKVYNRKYGQRFSIISVKTYHDEVHAGVLFIYHFIIGGVLFTILESDITAGLLFLPPLLLFTTIGNWSVHHAYLQKQPRIRLLLAFSTIVGALFTLLPIYTQTLERILINFTAGVLLFIVIRESLPEKSRGKPLLFLFGIVTYAFLMLLLGELH